MLRRPAALAALALISSLGACAKAPGPPASPPPGAAGNDIAAPEAGDAEDPAQAAGGLVADASPRTTPLAVGDAAPAFTLTDANGESFSLASKLESGPVIAIFYRGHW